MECRPISECDTPGSSLPPLTTFFEVNVKKDTFKFNAAHFVAYPGFRERLHGHNYNLAIRLLGSRTIGQDGYVLDFGDVKAVTKKVCKRLNEHFICPMYSPVIQMTEVRMKVKGEGKGKGGDDENGDTNNDDTHNDDTHNDNNNNSNVNIHLVCEDGATFSFPKTDCAILPIAHSTAEELAIYLWGEILLALNAQFLRKRGIHTMEVTCAEAIGQEAVFRMRIPNTNDKDEIKKICNVKSYISSGAVFAKPCPSFSKSKPEDDNDDNGNGNDNGDNDNGDTGDTGDTSKNGNSDNNDDKIKVAKANNGNATKNKVAKANNGDKDGLRITKKARKSCDHCGN